MEFVDEEVLRLRPSRQDISVLPQRANNYTRSLILYLLVREVYHLLFSLFLCPFGRRTWIYSTLTSKIFSSLPFNNRRKRFEVLTRNNKVFIRNITNTVCVCYSQIYIHMFVCIHLIHVYVCSHIYVYGYKHIICVYMYNFLIITLYIKYYRRQLCIGKSFYQYWFS